MGITLYISLQLGYTYGSTCIMKCIIIIYKKEQLSIQIIISMNSFCHKMLRTLKLTKAIFFVVFSLHLFSLSVTDQDV